MMRLNFPGVWAFRHFLGYPKTIPDRSTVWLFRERLAQTGKDTAIWDEFQRQLEAQGLAIKRGVIQDASFITTDPGHASATTPPGRPGPDAAEPRGHLDKERIEVAVRLQTPHPHG